MKKDRLVNGVILGTMLFLIIITPIVIVTSIINNPLKLINGIALFLLCIMIGILIDEIYQRRDKK